MNLELKLRVSKSKVPYLNSTSTCCCLSLNRIAVCPKILYSSSPVPQVITLTFASSDKRSGWADNCIPDSKNNKLNTIFDIFIKFQVLLSFRYFDKLSRG